MKLPRWCAFVALLWIRNASAAEAQCVYSVSPTTFSVSSTAGNRTVTIISGTQCSWGAVSTASWITVATGASGVGIGSAMFVIEANASGAVRTGTVTVAGQTISITQEAASCTYSITPTSFSIGATSTIRTLSIVAGTQCSWTATSPVPWITITDGGSGSGIGSVSFSIEANPGAGTRTTALAVAGQSVSIVQTSGSSSGVVPPAPANVRIVR